MGPMWWEPFNPWRKWERICREKDVLFFVDAAQSAGAIPIDMEREKIDLLAFTGHKALFGPQGTGGLVSGRGWMRGNWFP